MKPRTIIVFSPHPDDETFGCGGTIAKRLREGSEVWVVQMTDGRHAYSQVFGINTDPTPEELVTIRNAEVRGAMEILGLKRENLIFLGFEDGTLEEKEDEAQELVIKILMRYTPAEVYCTHEMDNHPDHRAASRIIKNSIKETHLDTMRYEYCIWGRNGPFGTLARLRSNLNRSNKKTNVDVSDFLSLKEAAIKSFGSQINVTSERQDRPVVRNFKRFLKNEETFFVGG